MQIIYIKPIKGLGIEMAVSKRSSGMRVNKDGMVYFLIWPDYWDTLVMSFLSYNATTGGGSLYSQENSELVGHVPLDLDISYLKLSKLLYSLLFPHL